MFYNLNVPIKDMGTAELPEFINVSWENGPEFKGKVFTTIVNGNSEYMTIVLEVKGEDEKRLRRWMIEKEQMLSFSMEVKKQ